MNKVLIIDSGTETTKLLTDFFIRGSYDVLTFSGYQSLFIGMEVMNPDIVLIACEVENISGFDICKSLRAMEKLRDTPIIIFGERDDINTTTRAIASGADDYFPLTYNIQILNSKIKSLIRISGLRIELTKRYKEIEEKNEILETQLKMGKLVQRALIEDTHFTVNDMQIVTRYMPAIEIGGDFYNVIRVNDNLISVVIGDVSGHGISAALLTAMLSMMTRSLVPQYVNPAQVLFHMNNELCKLFEKSELPLYVCMFYALIDTRKKMLYYSNAGQPQPFYIGTDGVVKELECSGMPVGMLENTVYEFRNHKFDNGDLLLMYTDGLSDNRYKEQPDEFYGTMKELLSELRENQSPEDIMQSLENTFTEDRGNELEKFTLDDVSMVLCKM